MFRVTTFARALLAAVSITAVALLALQGHLLINYEDGMRAVVRGRATLATVVVAFPLALLVMLQMLRNTRLSAELQRLVDRDRLTDVGTRDYFFARITERPDA